MKITKAELEQLCAEESYGSRIDCVYLDVENKRVFATDGHALVRRSVEVHDCDISGVISRDVLQYARAVNADIIERSLSKVVVKRTERGSGVVRTLAEFKHELGAKYPTLAQLDGSYSGFSETPFAVINVGLLVRLAESFQQRFRDEYDELREAHWCHVALFSKAQKPTSMDIKTASGEPHSILVVPVRTNSSVDEDCLGVIMPVNVEAPTLEEALSRGAKKASEQ